jgi:demethylmenaquinone methyltransferase/2-methoxy-6-polyprenyl-1,4-benzoquinol methylase
VAKWYDLANHLLSCGADFYWRKRAAQMVANWHPSDIIDLATGTGDLAIAMQRVLPNAEITGADFSPEMLEIARGKGLQNTVVADVLALPFTDDAFNCVTIAFGLRNIQDWGAALREMARILKPGGHLLILEFSLPRLSILRAPYRIYLHRLLPLIASVVTGSRDSYRYLGASIENFPGQAEMARLIENSRFMKVCAQPLTGGIVTIFTATKSG